jgi:hypothetical protein
MNTPRTSQKLTFKCDLHFQRRRHGQLELRVGKAPTLSAPAAGRVPRVARLMALAIRFEDLIQRGEVADYAELARLGHVTRARVTQIMNLLMLAPDIQESILFLPPVESGHDPIREWQVRAIAATPMWPEQQKRWRSLVRLGAEPSAAGQHDARPATGRQH